MKLASPGISTIHWPYPCSSQWARAQAAQASPAGSRYSMTTGSDDISTNGAVSSSPHGRSSRREVRNETATAISFRRRPGLEHRLGIHRLDIRPHPLLHFLQQLLLQRLHLRQSEELPHLVRRAF